MKFTSLAALCVVLASDNHNVNAFTTKSSSFSLPRTSFLPRKQQQQLEQQKQPFLAKTKSSSSTLLFLVETSGGMEELQELTDSDPAVVKQVRKSPSLWKMAGYASIPLSAALGFGLIGSKQLVAGTASAVVTGLAGAVGKSRLDALTETAALPAIAQVILDRGLENPQDTSLHIQNVQETYGVLQEDFDIMCTTIYTKYLLGMVKYQNQAKTSELKELDALRTALSLDKLQVGEAHAAAAEEWYRTTCLFTPEEDLEDPGHPDRIAMDKLLFLSERAIRSDNETPEAFTFEMTRVAKALHLDGLVTAMERVANVVEPFYQRALLSTRTKLETNQVSSAMLERARKTLGVSDETAKDMHVACFNDEVRALLGQEQDDDDDDDDASSKEDNAATLKFPEGARERLDKLRDLLGLTETDAGYEITLEATPLYQATALAAMKDVLDGSKTPDDAWKEMDLRRQELLLLEESGRALISSMVMQALGGPLEETNKFAKVNNEAATYDRLLEALQAKEALISILEKSGWDEFDKFDETFCNPWNKQSANGFLSTEERVKLYRIFLTRSVRKSDDGKLSDETYQRILQVKGLLGITDQQAEIEARAVFGPELQKVLQRAMMEVMEDYTPQLVVNLQTQVDEVVDNYRLTREFLREVGAGFYTKAVATAKEKSPAGIPTKEQTDALEALLKMYSLEKEDTYPAHMEYFGSVYKKSVLEAMGSTGVIRPEFRDSLQELRDRLGVSEDNTQELFLEAVQEKMVPMVEWISAEMERTMLTQQQLSERRGKDMGEDVFQTGKSASGTLGIGAEVNLMGDIMELVDFYRENDIAEEKEVGTKTIEKKGENDEMVQEEVPVFETSYPVTALGVDAIDQETAELLYRQFVVGGFTTQGPQGARYEEARATFGGILGLTSEKMEEIGNNIGSTVYDNFISNSMKTKGVLDQQDMMFLANIQGKLGLSEEQSEKMLLESQKKVLSEEINNLMDEPTPEGIKVFREKCNAMGMDLAEDVGISKQRLTRMFESEIIPGLKSGEITVENADILTEIQESLGIESDEVEAMFEAVLVRLTKNAVEVVKGELLRGREENTVDLLKEIVRYAAFVDGDLGVEIDESTANQMLNVYEALDFSGEEKSVVEANQELLKIALQLS